MAEQYHPAEKLYEALEAYFQPSLCTEVFPKIGLQYHHADRVRNVWTATFAGGEVFEFLRERGETDCLLFTHHPLGQRDDLAQPPPPIAAEHLALMERNRITLFSYHIPLDRNGVYSPGNRLAAAIGATPREEFYRQNQVLMGVICDTPYDTATEVAQALEQAVGHKAKLYPYGGEALQGGRIAIMAGGAKNTAIYKELREKGVRLFLTGVTTPAVPWVADIHAAAKEQGVSLLGGTHYSTEKFAAMAMTEFFQKLGLPAEFIPETPNLREL